MVKKIRMVGQPRKPKVNRFESQSPEYKNFRRQVFERDGYKCQMPGCKRPTTNKLVPHHIKRWADCPSLRMNVNNAITVCNSCHCYKITGRESELEGLFLGIIASKCDDSLSILFSKYAKKPEAEETSEDSEQES